MFHKVFYEWFRVTQYIPELGLFYKNEDFTWRVSDCEELVGLLTGDDENDIKIKNFLKVLIVPVFLLNRNKPLLLLFCANLHV